MQEKTLFYAAVSIFVLIIAIALFYGLCNSEMVVMWKNSIQGFFKHFAMERVYFLYPFLWYFELALVVFIYQIAGGLFECAWTGSLAAALQDFRLGLAGMALQIFGGYAFIKYLIRK